MAGLPREGDAVSIWSWASLAGSAGFPCEPGGSPGTRLWGPHLCILLSPQHPWERGETQLPWEINLLSEMQLPWEVHLVWEMHLPWEMHRCLPPEPPLRGRRAANPGHAFLLPCLLARFMPFGSSRCWFGPGSGQAGVLGCPVTGLPVQQSWDQSGPTEDPHKHKSE